MMIETLDNRTLMSATTVDANVQPDYAAADAAIVVSQEQQRQAGYGMTADQKLRAARITSTFENTSTELRYAYIQNLPDGRGFTAGRAGFTTGTGDFCELVRRYTAANSGNPLAQYMWRLEELEAEFAASDYTVPAGSIQYLDGIEDAWAASCEDPAFLAAQDSLVDDFYYNPAMEHAGRLGLAHDLSKAQLWDAIIQHGNGYDPDGLRAMIAEATDRTGGETPATGADEAAWIGNFLDVRRETLEYAHNADSRYEWSQSVERVDVFIRFLDAGNLDLAGDLSFSVFGHDFFIGADGSSGETGTDEETDGGDEGDDDDVIVTTGTGSISGRVFFDEDHDGAADADESGSDWRTVFIDTDNDWYCDEDEVRTYTDANGNYTFSSLAAGTYNVRLESVEWAYGTTPMNQQVEVTAGRDTGNVLFGEW